MLGGGYHIKKHVCDVFNEIHDSRPFQLGNDTVGRQEFDFPVENAQF